MAIPSPTSRGAGRPVTQNKNKNKRREEEAGNLIECRILSAGGSSPSSNQEPTTASSSSHPLTNRTSPAFLRVMDNGTLIIRSARKSLQGRYTCRAVNRIGQDLAATISISVHGTSISLSLYFWGDPAGQDFKRNVSYLGGKIRNFKCG
jgi:hypothetical protein